MKKYFKLTALITFIAVTLILIISIFPKTLPATPHITPTLPIPTSSAPDYGITILEHGSFTNLEAQKKFVEAYQQGNSGQWQKVVYTYEGDPIFYIVHYNHAINSLEVYVDTRQDNFGGKAISFYICKNIETSNDDFSLIITGCNNSPNGEVYIP